MFTNSLVIGVAVLTFFGLRISKANIGKGLDTTVRFRLRYTLIIIFVLGYTAYVDNLSGEDQVVMIDYTNELLKNIYHQLEVAFNEAIDWMKNIFDTLFY
ncbi:MAG: hypothetical protein ACJAXJ_003534 [Colwellia sp.]|jgi:hypothetical protein